MFRRTITAIALVLAVCESAFAQGTTATILGFVKDGSGAAVAGAAVKATNVETNVTRATLTGNDGAYQIIFLPVGTYRVDIDMKGFKRFEQTGIVLDVNRNAREDATLEVGQLTETVEVKAEAPLVESKSP